MDSTTVPVYPDNADNRYNRWIYPYEFSTGEFDATNKWHLDDWPMIGIITYTIGLEYR